MKVSIANNGSARIDFLAGWCVDGDGDKITLPATLTKRLDQNWTAGDGGGGLDTGTKQPDSTYHCWVIGNPSTGATDALFSVSAYNPALPAGYTFKSRRGAILTDGSANIIPFQQTGKVFDLIDPPLVYGPTSTPTTPALTTLPVPKGVKLYVNMFLSAYGQAGGYMQVWDADLGAKTLSVGYARFYQPAGVATGTSFRTMCSNMGKVYIRGTQTASITSTRVIFGWEDVTLDE